MTENEGYDIEITRKMRGSESCDCQYTHIAYWNEQTQMHEYRDNKRWCRHGKFGDYVSEKRL